jgi:UDP-glucuronate 4-epimerase
MLSGEKILVTGPGSQVALPLVRELAPRNTVYGLARFTYPVDRERLEALGVQCVRADLADGSFGDLPNDFDYVLHFAVVKSGDDSFDYDLAANAEGVGRLMAHCRKARAFLHCSTAGIYEYAGREPRKETDPLGDNHRAMLPTYSICKIAAETVVRFAARQWNIPTTIARLSVPFGDNGGWPALHVSWMLSGSPIPVHPERPNVFNPIHEDDYIAQVPKLLEVASVPATVVNWGGVPVALEEWCEYAGELVGAAPSFIETDRTIGSIVVDRTRMLELIGETRVPWRDGIRRMIAARFPEHAARSR